MPSSKSVIPNGGASEAWAFPAPTLVIQGWVNEIGVPETLDAGLNR